MHPLLVALALCLVSIFAEAIAAGSNPRACLRLLRQPTWALPSWSWYVVGLFFYAACLLSLLLVLQHDPSLQTRAHALNLLIAVMIVNVLWNATFFRLQALGLSFWIFILFSLLTLITVYRLYWLDGEAAAPFLPYLLYLPYGCAWSYTVWKRNRGQGSLGGTRN